MDKQTFVMQLAEKLMHWQRGEEGWMGRKKETVETVQAPLTWNPLENRSDAWMLLDKINDWFFFEYRMTLENGYNRKVHTCEVYGYNRFSYETESYEAEAETDTLAICYVAGGIMRIPLPETEKEESITDSNLTPTSEEIYWDSRYESPTDTPDVSWIERFPSIFEKKKHVLELGCGSGELGGKLMHDGHTYVGLDLSTVALEEARHRLPQGSWIQHDLRESLPLFEQTFEVVIASLSLHYFKPDVMCRILDDIRQVMSDTGTLIVRINSSSDPEVEKDSAVFRRYFNEEELREWLVDWDILHLEEVCFPYYGKNKIAWEGIASKECFQ